MKDSSKTKTSPLFSPHDVPGLYDAFGQEEFDDLYRQYEADEEIPKTSISARSLFLDLVKERAETGRIYVMNIDHCNSHFLPGSCVHEQSVPGDHTTHQATEPHR
jgi:ribonucleotide reductase alpha subunit